MSEELTIETTISLLEDRLNNSGLLEETKDLYFKAIYYLKETAQLKIDIQNINSELRGQIALRSVMESEVEYLREFNTAVEAVIAKPILELLRAPRMVNPVLLKGDEPIVCPHCSNSVDYDVAITKMKNKHRKTMKCLSCEKRFIITKHMIVDCEYTLEKT